MPAGRLGRLPRDHSRFALTLEDYFRTHPVSKAAGLEPVADGDDVDRATRVTEWPVYLNDSIGDCTVAGIAHAVTAMSVFAGKGQPLFSDSEIIKAYSAVSGYDPATGANDNGAQMQDVLAYMRSTGLTDESGKTHKVAAYAALRNPSDSLLLSECLKTFGACYAGIDCPQSALDQFGQGPWTYEPGSPIAGGHAISLHRRQPYGSRVGVFEWSTWGALQPATIGFQAHYVTEAWVFLTPDWLEVNGDSCDGLSLAQLQSDMALV